MSGTLFRTPTLKGQDSKKKKKKRTEKMNRLFFKTKGDMHMANRYLKMCSISLIIREIQIKTTVSYHFTPLKIAISKKTRDNKC